MTTTLHSATIARAHAAIKAGKVDHGEWTAPADSERTQDDCVGSGKSYPIFKGDKVSAKGVASALGYARQYAKSLVPSLEKLDEAIKGKAKVAASADGMILECSTPSGSPAVVIGQGYPKDLNGVPCSYYRKEIARAGHYTHRGKPVIDASGNPGWAEFDITPERMDAWAMAFRKRLEAGIKPFVPERHVAGQADARANLGYVVDVDRKGDSLYGTFQIIGDEAEQIAARNDVSVYVVGPAADSKGGTYDECIEHVCLTANPVIPNLEPFERIAASADPAVTRDVLVFVPAGSPKAAPRRKGSLMTPEIAKKARETLGLAADIPDDQLDDKVAERAIALHGDVDKLTKERDAKAQQIIALSADAAETKDPLALSLIARAFKTDREAVIASGVVSEAGMKEIDLLLFSEGKPTRQALALSAGGTDPFYSRLCEILRRHPGIKSNKPASGSTVAQPLALSADEQEAANDNVAKEAREQAEKFKKDQLAARGITA